MIEIAGNGVVDDDKPVFGVVLVTEIIVKDFSEIAVGSGGILVHHFGDVVGYTIFFNAIVFNCIDLDNGFLLVFVQSFFLSIPFILKVDNVLDKYVLLV